MIEKIVLSLLSALFVAMLGLMWLGRRVGARRASRDPHGWRAGTAAIEGAVFGLTTLLVAFTFSGAETRFEARRHLIVDEANAIQTTYLRLDLLPPATQPQIRDEFRRYVESRISIYDRLPDVEAARRELERSNGLQQEIWRDCLAALHDAPDLRALLLLVPSLNQMIDLTTARTTALETHPSPFIFALLGLLALACAFIAGSEMAKSAMPNRLLALGFSGLIVLTLAVILDFEFPRLGFIRIDPVDRLLADVRASMH